MEYTLSPATPNGNPLNTLYIEFTHEHGDADISTSAEKYIRGVTQDKLGAYASALYILHTFLETMDTESGTSYAIEVGTHQMDYDECQDEYELILDGSYIEIKVGGVELSFELEYDRVYTDNFCVSGIDRIVYFDDCGMELSMEIPGIY